MAGLEIWPVAAAKSGMQSIEHRTHTMSNTRKAPLQGLFFVS